MVETRRKLNTADSTRLGRRAQFWPGSDAWVWDMSNKDTKGFATLPRLMPWIMSLIDHLGGKSGAASKVYLELWCRDFGQSIITITDENECAYAAGYSSNRGLRTWRERMLQLIELKFILALADGNREYGQVLLLNPLAVCAYWKNQNRVPEEWWTSFVRRAGEIKAEIPTAFTFPNPKTPI